MVSLVLGLALAVQAEPKLEWATFGEFAEQLNEDSGYRLTMDKSISDRPMVWYFSNPGEDKLVLLQRSCKELCLDVAVDEQLKKIFVIGPNKDAGWTLRAKIEANWRKSQELIRANWGLSKEELVKKAEALSAEKQVEKDPVAAAMIDAEINFLNSLQHEDDRAVLACVLAVSPESISSRLAANRSGDGIVLVPREAAQILDATYRGNPPTQQPELQLWEQRKKFYDAAIADGGRLVIQHDVSQTGSLALLLRLDGRTKHQIIAATALSAPQWLFNPADEKKDMVPKEIASEPYNEKAVAFWGIDGLNSWQTLAIEHKWNTVGWVEIGRPQSSSTTTLELLGRFYPVRVKLTEDGWMVPYIFGQRWPEYSGQWTGIMKMTDFVKPEMTRDSLTAYLESVTEPEFDGMSRIKPNSFTQQVMNLSLYGRLIRAALREAKDRGVQEFDLGVNELGIGASGDVSRFWPFVVREEMKTPVAMSRRGLARLRLIERVMSDPDGLDFPDQRIMRVVLSVPIGDVAPSGNPLWVTEEAEIVLVKN